MTSPYVAPALLGAMAGARSQSVLAFVAWRGLDGMLASPLGRAATTLAALGEVVGDKTPWVPDRTAPGPLAGRMAFGAIGAAAIARAEGVQMLPSVLVGGAAAGLATLLLHRARRWLGQHTPLPDVAIALTEDAGVVALALVAARSLGGGSGHQSKG